MKMGYSAYSNTLMANLALSNNDRAFIRSGLDGGERRADGRQPLDLRTVRVQFQRKDALSQAEIQLGQTRVRAVVTSEIAEPFQGRPAEGLLMFNVEWRPADQAGSRVAGGLSNDSVELGNFLQVRESLGCAGRPLESKGARANRGGRREGVSLREVGSAERTGEWCV